jgi:DNA-directed RNA polymerase specialized sigma24 family protein
MEKYLNLIRKITWSFHKTTGLDWDDLFSEAVESYFRAMEHYDAEKSGITTFVSIYITHSLVNYIKKQKEINEPMTSIDEEDFYYLPSNEPSPFWEYLTQDAQKIADLICRYSKHFVCLDTEQAEQRVIQIMTHPKLGWSEERTLAGLRDLKQACGYRIEKLIV